MTLIKVGFLVSYDWYLLRNALPLIYAEADVVYLALDKKRLTWAGNTFNFDDEAFYKMIGSIDTDKKIKVYEDDFFMKNLTPMQCEVRERNLLAQQMGEGGWHIQLDADEYFLNFKGFIEYLKNKPIHQKPINICVAWLNLFKKISEGYLYIQNKHLELIQIATNTPIYEHGRRNYFFNHISPFFILHDTWARSEEEVWQKVSNWGHKDDFDIVKYFNFWKALDEKNYKQIIDFHPISPSVWGSLDFVKGQSVEQIVEKFTKNKFPLSKFELFLKNNRNLARIKHLWSKMIK